MLSPPTFSSACGVRAALLRGILLVSLPLFAASAFLALFSPDLDVYFSPFIRVKVALRSENVRPWHEVEHDFIDCEYRAVRDRQMKELELEDDLLSKVPVRLVA